MPMTPLDASLYNFTIAIQPARRVWIQAAGAALANSGLSVSVAAVVVLVARLGPGVQQKVLAIEAGVNPAALVRTLDQGEAAGLLTRRDVPENRRIKVIDLLPERSEEHTSELQSLMRISYAVFCLKKKKQTATTPQDYNTINKPEDKI